jgi:hypothetical protein
MHAKICVLTSNNWYTMQTNMSEISLSWKENLNDNDVAHFNFPVTGKKTICVHNVMDSMSEIAFVMILTSKQRVCKVK